MTLTVAGGVALALLVWQRAVRPQGVGPHQAPPPATRPTAPPAVRPPDILLFTIDTLRADHTSTYGYARETTPTLTQLAGRGARFEHAYATATWTTPSLASVFTGVLPSEHGVTREQEAPDGSGLQTVLPPELPSLTESLQRAGYHTLGVTMNTFLVAGLGFERGFDEYVPVALGTLADLRAALAPRLAGLRASGQPFFLWVHVLDAHAPYHTRSPAFDAFWPAPRPRFPELQDVMQPELFDQLLANDPGGERKGYVVAAYDSEIQACDAYLAELLAALAPRPLAVLVAGDHGEEFADHGRYGHGHTMFEESLRVPLVVALPGASAGRVEATPVSLVDVLPTLVEVGGAPLPAGLAGRSLLPALRGEALAERPVFAEIEWIEGASAVISGDEKYAESAGVESAPSLYELRRDPAEQHNLAATQPARSAELRRLLRTTLAAARARQPLLSARPFEPPDLEKLRALGYVH